MPRKKKGKRASGEGTLRERKDGLWEARIKIGRDDEGKIKFKSFYGKSQQEAKEKRDQYLAEVKLGEYIEPDKITVGQWISDWLRVFVKPNKKHSTYAKYDSLFRTHIEPAIGKLELQKLTTTKVQEFYNIKKDELASSSLSVIHIILNGAMEFAVDEDKIKKNPAKKTIRPPVKHKEVIPMSEVEMDKFLEAAKDHRMFAAFFVDLTTGLRRGELLALRWKNIDLKKGIIKVRESLNRVQIEKGKTELVFDSLLKNKNAKRDVPLLPETVKVLEAHKLRQKQEKNWFARLKSKNTEEEPSLKYEDQDLVFCTEMGRPYEPRNLLRLQKSLLTKAELRQDITIHNMRHTFSTMLLRKKVNLKSIIDLLGHADERMLMRTYGHSNDEDLRNAIQELSAMIKVQSS